MLGMLQAIMILIITIAIVIPHVTSSKSSITTFIKLCIMALQASRELRPGWRSNMRASDELGSMRRGPQATP